MKNVKTLAILSACAALAFGGFANAGSFGGDQLNLTQPVTADTMTSRPFLMAEVFDRIGAGKTMDDWKLTVGGYAEGSFTYYADKSPGKAEAGRVFDLEHEDPTVNQVGLWIDRPVDASKSFDWGFKIEGIWGGDARFIHSTGLGDHEGFGDGPDEQFDLVQAYGLFGWSGWTLKAGKFVTPFGVETINPTTTPIYSRGLLFTYLLPFTHTGATLMYSPNDTWTFEGGVVRGWDDALEDKNADGVSFLGIATYNFADKKQQLIWTAIAGPEYPGDTTSTRTLIEVVYKYKWADNLTLMAEGDFLWETDQDSDTGPSNKDGYAGGVGGWVIWVPGNSKYWTVNGRLEYLYDGSGMRFSPVSNNVYSATAGLTITPWPDSQYINMLKIRPEVRWDYAERAAFGGDSNSQFSFGLEAYITF